MLTITNLPKLILDPQNETELTQLTYNRIRTASGNTITDFRPGSAVAALVEGQTFALAELLYYLNMLPEAIAIEVFRLYGVERSLGTRASGELTFLLTEVTLDTFVLPAGYAIPYLDTQLVLLNTLSIPVGSQEATVSVQVADVGAAYNANAYDLVIKSTGLVKVNSIYNRLPFTGGSNLESLSSLVSRCQTATQSRTSVITKLDYELAAQVIMGEGSRAVLIPNLATDKVTKLNGTMALFLLDSSGTPASLTTCAQVLSALKLRVLVGTDLNCFPAELNNVSIEVFCNVTSLTKTLGQAIIKSIVEYLNPTSFSGGTQLRHNELEYVTRSTQGVTSVDSLLMNGQAIDLLAPNVYAFFNPDSVSVSMLDQDGVSLTVYGGLGVDADVD